jgi:hypothetical protein
MWLAALDDFLNWLIHEVGRQASDVTVDQATTSAPRAGTGRAARRPTAEATGYTPEEMRTDTDPLPQMDDAGGRQAPRPPHEMSLCHDPQTSRENQHISGERALKKDRSWLLRRLWDSWHFDRQPSLFDALTTLVSVIGVIVVLGQIRQTSESLREAREANQLARKTLESTQRPYVTVNGLDVQPVLNANGRIDFWRAIPIVVNNGNLPTKNLWWTAVVGDVGGITMGPFMSSEGRITRPFTTERRDSPHTQTFDDLKNATRNRFALGPHQESRALAMAQVLPASYVDGIKKSTVSVFIHGAFLYQDSLTNTGHITRFCYMLWHNPAISAESVSSDQCGGVYSCHDEECPDYDRLKALAAPAAAIK